MFDAYLLMQIRPFDKYISSRYVFHEVWVNNIPSDNPVALPIAVEFESAGFRNGRKPLKLGEKPTKK